MIGQICGVGVAIKENVDVPQWAEVRVQEILRKFEMSQLNLSLFLFLHPGEDVMRENPRGFKPAAMDGRRGLI